MNPPKHKPNDQPPRRPTQGFPLGSIFLLVALVAVVVAQLGWAISNASLAISSLPVTAVVGGGWGGFCGVVIGLYHFRRGRGVAIGVVSGTIFGAMMGPICAASLIHVRVLLAMSIAGSVGLIGLATIYRLVNSHDPVSKQKEFRKLLQQHKAKQANVSDHPIDRNE